MISRKARLVAAIVFACALPGCPQEAVSPEPWAALPVVVSSADAASVTIRLDDAASFTGKEAGEVSDRGAWKKALPLAVRAKLETAGFKFVESGAPADLIASVHGTDVEWTGHWWESRGNVDVTFSNPADQSVVARAQVHFGGVNFEKVPDAAAANLGDAVLRSAELASFVQAKRAKEEAAKAPPPPPPPPPAPPPPPPPPPNGLEPGSVKTALAPLRAQYRACYDAGLVRDPSLAGTVVLKLEITPDGALESVGREASSTLTDAGVTSCIVDATKPVTFPHSERKTSILYPLELATGPAPEISAGGIEAVEIHKALRGASDKTRACFEAGLKKDPTLGGVIKVKFSISTKGALLSAASAPDSSLKEKAVEKCVLGVVRGLKFPKAAKKTDVTYAIELPRPN